jgi:thioredoxin 1
MDKNLTRDITGGKKLKPKRSTLIAGILIAIGIALVLIIGCSDQAGEKSKTEAASGESQADAGSHQTAKLPMLVDLGKGTCIACKKMKPILEELTKEYEGRAIVKFIDLRYEPQAARQYGIRLIPTQIFYDSEGNEVYRHQGFMDKRSIKMKFAEMGVY